MFQFGLEVLSSSFLFSTYNFLGKFYYVNVDRNLQFICTFSFLFFLLVWMGKACAWASVNRRNKLSRNALTLEMELLQIRQSLSHLASISSPCIQKDETGSRGERKMTVEIHGQNNSKH